MVAHEKHLALGVLLLLTVAAPVSVGEGEASRLVTHRGDGAGWASFLVDFDGPGTLDLWTRYETWPQTRLAEGREAATSAAIIIERLRADGGWQVAGGAQSPDCAREAHRAYGRIEGAAPGGLAADVPAGAHPFQGGASVGSGIRWSFASTFRITAFGAGHDAGDFWITADGTAGVSVRDLRTGDHVGYLTSDEGALVGAYAQANQFSTSIRSGGRIDFPVEHRLYTAMFVSNAPDNENWADYRGPAAGWNQIRGNEAEVFDGPPGQYSIEFLATLGIGWSNVIAGTFDGASAQCPATWLLADVDPPQAP